MPLLRASSAFLTSSLLPLVKRLSPSRPSPCPCHSSLALGRLSCLRPLCRVLACSHPKAWARRSPSSLSCSLWSASDPSLPSLGRANLGRVPDTGWTSLGRRPTMLVRGCQSVSLVGGDDASVEGVSRQQRSQGEPFFPSDWVGRTVSAGFTPRKMPSSDAWRIPLASLFTCCSHEQLHRALQAHPTHPIPGRRQRASHAPTHPDGQAPAWLVDTA